jgi:hypothetical protein
VDFDSLSNVVARAAQNWWEPGTPGLFDIGDASVFLGTLLAFSAILAGVSRIWVKTLRRVVKEEITVATEPIHPSGNGGLSLADVARKTAKLETCVNKIAKQNEETRDLLIKVLASSVYIPDTVPEEGPKKVAPRSSPRSRRKAN